MADKKEINVSIFAVVNCWEKFTVSLDEFLSEEEIKQIEDGSADLEDFEESFKEYAESNASGEDPELYNYEMEDEKLAITTVSDYKLETDDVITRDTTAEEFLDNFYIDVECENHQLGYADVWVTDDIDYGENTEKYFSLGDYGEVKRDFEKFKAELFSGKVREKEIERD